MPSRFVDELPEDHVEVLTPPGLYGGAYGGASNFGHGAMADVGGGYSSTIEKKAQEANVYNSPGWKRMQANAARTTRRDPVIIDAKAIPDFSLGDRVFHQKFGYGAVEAVDDDKLTVAFEKAGQKKVVANYVTKADDVEEAPF
jgi:DNA helicase-2/ATP-dependent DNA helicase PcrA